jgi:hypothetical protein
MKCWTGRRLRCAVSCNGWGATGRAARVWLGHPLHPAVAQVALGSFTSAALIDAFGGRRRESSLLIAVGLASTLPTAAAGWADWSDSHGRRWAAT